MELSGTSSPRCLGRGHSQSSYDRLIVCWMDLRTERCQSNIHAALGDMVEIHLIEDSTMVAHSITTMSPQLIVFDFDYPDLPRLLLLQGTIKQYRTIPALIMTQFHSEDLAVWAFRIGVWDYLVKPLTIEDVKSRVESLSHPQNEEHWSNRTISIPTPRIPLENRFCSRRQLKSTLPAVRYIECHFNEDIKQCGVASLCQMSTFAFSRIFKRENGLTFKEYLMRYRIAKALDLLNGSMSVTEVALLVGFNDSSYFSRIIRRFIGISPSQYSQSGDTEKQMLRVRSTRGDLLSHEVLSHNAISVRKVENCK